VTRSIRKLRLFVIADEETRRARAASIVTALGMRRPIEGDGPNWIVTYAEVETSEAFACCEADLNAIDPRWIEVLDFASI
jgi:hypothetical protein